MLDVTTSQAVEHAPALMRTEIEHVGSRTLRWTVGTMLAGNTAVVAVLGFLMR